MISLYKVDGETLQTRQHNALAVVQDATEGSLAQSCEMCIAEPDC